MKLLMGLIAAMMTMFACVLMNAFVLKFKIPDFTIGWMSCLAFIYTNDYIKRTSE